MMDISRDARWGELQKVLNTYLSGVLAVAMVNGFQGTDLSNPSSIAACAKHF
jgi:beta-glucosidase